MEEEKEIPRDEWAEFCREFSYRHQGWLVTIRETYLFGLSGVVGETLVENQKLWGVAAADNDDEWEISIIASEEPDHLVHLIHNPARIMFEQTKDGCDKGLRVESGEGLVTEVTFRTPARPDMLDGMSEAELLTMPLSV